MPRIARNTVWSERAARRFSNDERAMFASMRSDGATGAIGGMNRLEQMPATAISTSAPIRTVMLPVVASTVANSVPSRIARKVPISSSALPPTSSSVSSTCGSSPYLAGEKKVECAPIRNSAASSSTMSCSAKPRPASTMMPTSQTLTIRITTALSNRSASWPDSPENSTNGRMNRPLPMLVSSLGSSAL